MRKTTRKRRTAARKTFRYRPAHVFYPAIEQLNAKYPFKGTLLWISNDLKHLSPKGRNFFANMSLAKWHRWRPRYILLLLQAAVRTSPKLKPSMKWYEEELFAALVLQTTKSTDSASIN